MIELGAAVGAGLTGRRVEVALDAVGRSWADADGGVLHLPPVDRLDGPLGRGALDRAAARLALTSPSDLAGLDAEAPALLAVAEALEDGRVDRVLGAHLPGCAINLSILRAAGGPGPLAALTRLAAGEEGARAEPALAALPPELATRCAALATTADGCACAPQVVRALGRVLLADVAVRALPPPPRVAARGVDEEGGSNAARRRAESSRGEEARAADDLGAGRSGAGGSEGGAGRGAGLGAASGGEQAGDASPAGRTGDGGDGGDDGDGQDGGERAPGGAGVGRAGSADDDGPDDGPGDDDAPGVADAPGRRAGPEVYRVDASRDRVRVLSVAPHPRTAAIWAQAAPLGRALAARARLALPEEGPAWARDLDRGRLDERRLTRVATGDARVFRRRRPRRRVDAALSLLVDCSGSLCTTRHRDALVVALALALAGEALDVEVEVLGFTTLAARGPRPGLARAVPLEHLVLAPFQQPARARRHAFGHATSIERQNNVDGEAVAWAGARLARRGRRTQVLVVISDARPNAGERHDDGPDPRLDAHLRRVVVDLEGAGVVVLGAGVGVEPGRLADLYPRWAVVDDRVTLADVLGAALVDALHGLPTSPRS